MAASISASVDEVGVTSRLRGSVGARASKYRRAELEPMVARAAFEIPGTAPVPWTSYPLSAKRETWQDRRGRIGHDSTRRPGLSPHARALPPRLSEKDDRNAKSVHNPARLSFGHYSATRPQTVGSGQGRHIAPKKPRHLSLKVTSQPFWQSMIINRALTAPAW